MKTKDLIQKINGMRRMSANVEKNMIVVYEDGVDFSFYSYPINGKSRGDGYTNLINIRSIYMKELFELLDLIDEYRQTPESDREEEKRYYLRLNAPEAGSLTLYRTKGLGISETNLNVKKDWNILPFIFTESEITEMDITGFKKEPVE